MAYNKNTWVTGDTVTAEKLNNIEEGIASAYPMYTAAIRIMPKTQQTSQVIVMNGSNEDESDYLFYEQSN